MIHHAPRLVSRSLAMAAFLLISPSLGIAADPLPSWNEGPTKRAIVDFVADVTREGGSGFVPVADRVATFDNDGTLWSEQPAYFQLVFAADRMRQVAGTHPEWQGRP